MYEIRISAPDAFYELGIGIMQLFNMFHTMGVWSCSRYRGLHRTIEPMAARRSIKMRRLLLVRDCSSLAW